MSRSTGVVGIVLAAGRSRRMGRPKQLLPLADGRTVVETVVGRLGPHVDEVFVVIGHVAGQVAAVLAGTDARLVVNPDVDRGMLSSVRCALRAAGDGWAGYLVCLGDQPSLSGPVLARVLESARRTAKGIVLPVCAGRRGHPVYLARRYREVILALGDDCGLDTVTRSHPDDTVEVPVDEGGILDDMDTPADYDRERRRVATA